MVFYHAGLERGTVSLTAASSGGIYAFLPCTYLLDYIRVRPKASVHLLKDGRRVLLCIPAVEFTACQSWATDSHCSFFEKRVNLRQFVFAVPACKSNLQFPRTADHILTPDNNNRPHQVAASSFANLKCSAFIQ